MAVRLGKNLAAPIQLGGIVIALVCFFMRLAGRLWIAAADEIDRATSTYLVEVPDTIPTWVDEAVDLP